MERKPPLLNLIKPLIDSPLKITTNPEFSALLVQYAYTDYESGKIQLIHEMMHLLWGDKKRAQHLKFFAKFDGFMRAIGKRDHFIHQFEVFLFGWFIAHALQLKGHGIVDPKDASAFLEIWLMTAMGHDLGLPLQEEMEIIDVLRELHQSVGAIRIANDYGKFKDKLSKMGKTGRPVTKDLLQGEGAQIGQQIIKGIMMTTGLTKSQTLKEWAALLNSSKNHGVLSGLVLGRDLYRYFVPDGNFMAAEAANKPGLKDFRLMLSAISLHHLKEDKEDVVKRIRFSENPYACILYIADNLQEWDRDIGGWTDKHETSLTGFDFEDSTITLTFYLHHNDWAKDDAEKTVRDEINNADARVKWPQGPRNGLIIEALYQSNSKIINGLKIHLGF